ncbi:HopJ type III effector protein [Thiosulfativibrio zosterae]|uniref:Type III effector n=1 Tax=Thiosulfativibrio zosterae TaxID=2675053 RepID=A0A6F8PK11_9GAMM|nr:HopJ type III effector protein [Thiosulfativibrio zosterae]BBP42435.1 type III effector [Thiosulfativibrio zosterae]
MTPIELIEQLNQHPVEFAQVIATIENHYTFTPTEFHNGEQLNAANTNNGSCKIFAFAQMHQLSEQATLNAFGQFYTQDVLLNPNGDDHGNIRNFMKTGWSGVQFSGAALQAR